MSRSIWRGSAVLLLTVLAAGCGAAPEDKIVQEQLATIDKLTAAYASVVDDQTYKAVEREIGALRAKSIQLDKQLADMGYERKEAVLKKFAPELEQAQIRLKNAKKTAAKAAWNVSSSK